MRLLVSLISFSLVNDRPVSPLCTRRVSCSFPWCLCPTIGRLTLHMSSISPWERRTRWKCLQLSVALPNWRMNKLSINCSWNIKLRQIVFALRGSQTCTGYIINCCPAPCMSPFRSSCCRKGPTVIGIVQCRRTRGNRGVKCFCFSVACWCNEY